MLCFGHTVENVDASAELMMASNDSIQSFFKVNMDLVADDTFNMLVNFHYEHTPLRIKMNKASEGLIDGLGIQRIANAILTL